jgi:hypothetical protein
VFENFCSNHSAGHSWRFDYVVRKTVKNQLPFGKSARIPRPRTSWILSVITAVFATMAESSVAAISVEGTPRTAETQLLDLAKVRFGNDIWPGEGIFFPSRQNSPGAARRLFVRCRASRRRATNFHGRSEGAFGSLRRSVQVFPFGSGLPPGPGPCLTD